MLCGSAGNVVCLCNGDDDMTLKTLEDCAKCDYTRYCDAHVTGGSWRHRAGADPCELVVVESADRAPGILS